MSALTPRTGHSSVRMECPAKWPIADILQHCERCPVYPESGHFDRTHECPLRANSGRHPINSSARASNVGGTLRPSVLAVRPRYVAGGTALFSYHPGNDARAHGQGDRMKAPRVPCTCRRRGGGAGEFNRVFSFATLSPRWENGSASIRDKSAETFRPSVSATFDSVAVMACIQSASDH
jgi:hypothetical protein